MNDGAKTVVFDVDGLKMQAELGEFPSRHVVFVRPLCKNCKYWQKQDSDYPRGDCSSKKFLASYSDDKVRNFFNANPDGVNVENDEGWGFCTGPEFGCIHFEVNSPAMPDNYPFLVEALPDYLRTALAVAEKAAESLREAQQK